MRILVVDDEKLLVKGLRFNLENEGYQVDACYNGREALDLLQNNSYDLILLDLMMPEMDGLETTMHIRQTSMVPIIMLTAKSEDTDKLIGFEYGADDYVTKPFNILELKARIRALLRRNTISSDNSADSQALAVGQISIHPDRRLVLRDGEEIDLTLKEYDLIELLIRNRGKVYTRENLLNTVWGYDYQGDVRTVDVHIRRLREKLESDPANPQLILTKWGVGYYFKG